MVAHGTIAFDTLTTSDQVNTGTEKSIDTSYIFNGVAKCVCHYTTAGTFVNNFSFNTSNIIYGASSEGCTCCNRKRLLIKKRRRMDEPNL